MLYEAGVYVHFLNKKNKNSFPCFYIHNYRKKINGHFLLIFIAFDSTY